MGYWLLSTVEIHPLKAPLFRLRETVKIDERIKHESSKPHRLGHLSGAQCVHDRQPVMVIQDWLVESQNPIHDTASA
jgi:hypothetical protein